MYSEGGRAALPLGGIVAVEAAEFDKAVLVCYEGESGVPVLGDKLFKGESRLFGGQVVVEEATSAAVFVPVGIGVSDVAMTVYLIPVNDCLDTRV